MGKNEMGKNEMGKNEMGKNEMGKNEMGKNEMGKNEMGKNEMGKNEMGKNEIKKKKKIVLDVFVKNSNKKIIDNFSYLDLYEFCYKLYLSCENKRGIMFDIIKIEKSDMILMIFITGLLYNFDIYSYIDETKLNDVIILNNEILENIMNKKYKIKEFKKLTILKQSEKKNIYNKIYYKIKEKFYVTNWKNIINFYDSYNIILGKIINENSIFIPRLSINNIYILYFILFIIIDKIEFKSKYSKKSFTITDISKYLRGIGLYVCTIYSNYGYLEKKDKFSIFYSLNLNQYLLYNVIGRNNSIIGRVLSMYKISNNDIIYKDKRIKLPLSYKVLDNNILSIEKNNKLCLKDKIYRLDEEIIESIKLDVNIELSIINKYLVNNNFTKLIFLNSFYNINKNYGYELFTYLLKKYNYLNNDYYKKLNLVNRYVFHDNYNKINTINDSLFSIYVIEENNTIIVHLSYILEKYENIIISEIDNYIGDKYEEINVINDLRKINIGIEINYGYSIGIFLLYKFFYSIFIRNKETEKENLNRIQINYYFTKEELLSLSKKYKKNDMEYTSIFKYYLLKSLNKFFINYFVIINSEKIFPLCLYNNSNIIDYNKLDSLIDNSILVQKWLINFIFFFIYNRKIYNGEFIQISEKKIEKRLENIEIKKYNNKCEMNNFPIQIDYILFDNEILLTISSNKEYDILKKIIEEIINMINEY